MLFPMRELLLAPSRGRLERRAKSLERRAKKSGNEDLIMNASLGARILRRLPKDTPRIVRTMVRVGVKSDQDFIDEELKNRGN